jgi:hypothetical protein
LIFLPPLRVALTHFIFISTLTHLYFCANASVLTGVSACIISLTEVTAWDGVLLEKSLEVKSLIWQVCVYVCVYIYICVCVCVYICAYMCIYVCIYVYACMHVCMVGWMDMDGLEGCMDI